MTDCTREQLATNYLRESGRLYKLGESLRVRSLQAYMIVPLSGFVLLGLGVIGGKLFFLTLVAPFMLFGYGSYLVSKSEKCMALSLEITSELAREAKRSSAK
jgi:hypothetical protein